VRLGRPSGGEQLRDGARARAGRGEPGCHGSERATVVGRDDGAAVDDFPHEHACLSSGTRLQPTRVFE